jgi:transcriptional regulator with XRE-family HTH domain
MIQPRQIRAARALLNWSQQDLAKASGIAISSIKNIENGLTVARRDTLAAIQDAFEQAQIEFLSNSGVRVKSSEVEIYEGPERFDEFYNFIYEHLQQEGGDVCVSGVDERMFTKYRKDPEQHRNRMKELVDRGDVTFRILATESNSISSYAQYRWQPQPSAIPTSFYAFGDCLALVSFTHDPAPYVILIKSGAFTEVWRHAFENLWKDAAPMLPSSSDPEKK